MAQDPGRGHLWSPELLRPEPERAAAPFPAGHFLQGGPQGRRVRSLPPSPPLPSGSHEGNVMVGSPGSEQPVCDDSWTLINADVACKQVVPFFF
jgi:hypothetical protein